MCLYGNDLWEEGCGPKEAEWKEGVKGTSVVEAGLGWVVGE